MKFGKLALVSVLGLLGLSGPSFAADWTRVEELSSRIEFGGHTLGNEMQTQIDVIYRRPQFWRRIAVYDLFDFELAAQNLKVAVNANGADEASIRDEVAAVMEVLDRADGPVRESRFGYQIESLFDDCRTWANELSSLL